jgi:hypothetical protein
MRLRDLVLTRLEEVCHRCVDRSYQTLLLTPASAIYAQHIESLKSAAYKAWGRTPQKSELPDLMTISDVIWPYWARGNLNVANLRYYIVNNVVNTETLKLIARILRNKGMASIPEWPGLKVDDTQMEFEALLGTWSCGGESLDSSLYMADRGLVQDLLWLPRSPSFSFSTKHSWASSS